LQNLIEALIGSNTACSYTIILSLIKRELNVNKGLDNREIILFDSNMKRIGAVMISSIYVSPSFDNFFHDFNVAIECCDPEVINSKLVSSVHIQSLVLKH